MSENRELPPPHKEFGQSIEHFAYWFRQIQGVSKQQLKLIKLRKKRKLKRYC